MDLTTLLIYSITGAALGGLTGVIDDFIQSGSVTSKFTTPMMNAVIGAVAAGGSYILFEILLKNMFLK